MKALPQPHLRACGRASFSCVYDAGKSGQLAVIQHWLQSFIKPSRAEGGVWGSFPEMLTGCLISINPQWCLSDKGCSQVLPRWWGVHLPSQVTEDFAGIRGHTSWTPGLSIHSFSGKSALWLICGLFVSGWRSKSYVRKTLGASRVVLVKNPPANAGDIGDAGLIPGSGDPLDEGVATHSSILITMNRGAWWGSLEHHKQSRTLKGLSTQQRKTSDHCRLLIYHCGV